MANLVLKTKILERVKGDPKLFAKVAVAMSLGVRGTYALLAKNSSRLTQASVLKVIREELNIEKDSDLLEEKEDNPVVQAA